MSVTKFEARCVVDDKEYHHIVMKKGMWWWASYYVATRGEFRREFLAFIYPEIVSPPFKTKREAVALMKIME